MSDKQVKSDLKLIKTHISQKKYKEILKQIKKTTKIKNLPDKHMFLLMIYAGFSYFHLEQYDICEKTYRKAIKINKDSVQPYQGLCELYEKTKSEDKLLPIYVKLLEFLPKKKKMVQILKKLVLLQNPVDHPKQRDFLKIILGDENLSIENDFLYRKMLVNNILHGDVKQWTDEDIPELKFSLEKLIGLSKDQQEKYKFFCQLDDVILRFEELDIMENKVEPIVEKYYNKLKEQYLMRMNKKKRKNQKRRKKRENDETDDDEEIEVDEEKIFPSKKRKVMKDRVFEEEYNNYLTGKKVTLWNDLFLKFQNFCRREQLVPPKKMYTHFLSREFTLIIKARKPNKIQEYIKSCLDFMKSYSSMEVIEKVVFLHQTDELTLLPKEVSGIINFAILNYPHESLSQMLLAQKILRVEKNSLLAGDLIEKNLKKLEREVVMFRVSLFKNYYKRKLYKKTCKVGEGLLERLKNIKTEYGKVLRIYQKFEKIIQIRLMKSLWKLGKYQECKNCSKEILMKEKENVEAMYFFGKCLIRTHTKGVGASPIESVRKLYQKILGIFKSDQTKKTIPAPLRIYLFKVFVHLGQFEYKSGVYKECEKFWIAALKMKPKSSRVLMKMGMLNFAQKKEYEKGVRYFIQSMKQKPNGHYENFHYCGLYYLNHTNEKIKARKCFEKAIHLNPNDEESGERLIQLLLKNPGEKENIKRVKKLLKSIILHSPKVYWVFCKLAWYYLSCGKYQKASNFFQKAIRITPNVGKLWEGLGDSYKNQGKFISAKKAYKKACELDENNSYAKFHMGYISGRLLEEFNEAVECFNELIEILKSQKINKNLRVLILNGICEVYLGKTKQVVLGNVRDYKKGKELILMTNNVLEMFGKEEKERYLTIRNHEINCKLYSVFFPNSVISVEKKLVFLKEAKDILQHQISNEKNGLFEHQRAYHDLGIVYSFLYKFEKGETQLKEAYKNMRRAVQLNPQESSNWFHLAQVEGDFRTKSHCYSLSHMLDKHNFNALNNIAFEVIKKEGMKKNKEPLEKIFEKSKSISPLSNFLSFFGEGMIQESEGYFKEALASYDACLQIYPLKIAILKAVYFAIQMTIKSEKRMDDEKVVWYFDILKMIKEELESEEEKNLLKAIWQRYGESKARIDEKLRLEEEEQKKREDEEKDLEEKEFGNDAKDKKGSKNKGK